MQLTTFLQIFLFVDVFFIGVAATVAVRHANAHFRPNRSARGNAPPIRLSPALRQQMVEEAEHDFHRILDHTTAQLQKDLSDTSGKVSKLLDKLGSEVVSDELEHYKKQLEQLRQQTEADITGAKSEIEQHRNELRAQLAAEVAGEKEKLLQQIDTKLGDAVASFLVDTLQHEVDLGAQAQYLTKMLEEHKADFKKGVGVDENSAA